MRFLRYVLFWSCAAAAVCGTGCGCGNTESNEGETAKQPAAFNMDGAVLLDVRSPE